MHLENRSRTIRWNLRCNLFSNSDNNNNTDQPKFVRTEPKNIFSAQLSTVIPQSKNPYLLQMYSRVSTCRITAINEFNIRLNPANWALPKTLAEIIIRYPAAVGNTKQIRYIWLAYNPAATVRSTLACWERKALTEDRRAKSSTEWRQQ